MSHDDFNTIMRRVKSFLPYDMPPKATLTKAQLIEQIEAMEEYMREEFSLYFHRQKLGLDPMLAF